MHKYNRVKWTKDMLTPEPAGVKWILEHREVAANLIGRPLLEDEVVHHIDENRRNNKPDNLMVFRTSGDHSAYHVGAELIEHEDGTYSSSKNTNICLCGGLKDYKAATCKRCDSIRRRKVNPPDKAKLQVLAWSLPMTKVAEIYSVSDKTVAKWFDRFGVDKPPYGYWLK